MHPDTVSIHDRTPTFHDTPSRYALPNDTPEHNRLEQQHDAAMDLTLWRLPYAPLSPTPKLILDIGCGTGAATRMLATMYPDAKVIGMDISPVPYHSTHDTLPNLTFLRGSFHDLAKTEDRFGASGAGEVDYIFSRLLIFGMTDWLAHLSEVLGALRPGGWAELQEAHLDYLYDNPALMNPPAKERWEWLKALRESAVSLGLDPDCAINLEKYLQDSHFENVTRHDFRIEMTTDKMKPEHTSAAHYKYSYMLAEDRWGLFWHMIPRFLKVNGDDSPENVNRLREQMILDTKIEPPETGKHMRWTVTTGSKPEAKTH